MKITKKLITAAIALPLIALLAGCAGTADDANPTVKIGVVGASDPYWATYTQAAKDAGITVDIVDFAEYSQPNPALKEGELDLNQFQHIVYLADYNDASGSDLVPIGATAIYPLGLYSSKYASVADIQQGDTVAIPNDESNLARGLLVLQSAGLIKLKDGGTIFATLADIDEANSKVKVITLDPSLTASSLPDVAAAIINNDYVANSGLTAADAIAKDDPSDPNALPYVNIFAAKTADKDNATYLKLVEIYQNTKSVQDGVQEKAGGSAVLVKTPVADLQKSLADVEAQITAHKG
jgi:D-methionine transport system substrate-binding protein